VCVL
jgi:hypothetical protein